MENEHDVPVSKTYRLADTKYHRLLKLNVFPYSFTTLDRKCSATNMFCSFDMLIPRISLFSGSIATHTQIYSDSTLLIVSSITYSEIFFFFEDIF